MLTVFAYKDGSIIFRAKLLLDLRAIYKLNSTNMTSAISNPIYATRRQQFAQHMGANALAIIPTAPERMRNRDCDFPYRHDSYFYYLTGFAEPQALLLLRTDADKKLHATLLCLPKDLERETWDGYRLGPEAAVAQLGVDAAYPIAQRDAMLPKLLENTDVVWYPFATHDGLEAQVATWLQAVRTRVRYGVLCPHTLRDACVVLDEMRLIKDAHEIDLLRQAGKISAQAHIQAMRTSAHMLQAGQALHEYHLEAELLHVFRQHGAQAPAYNNIVAAGENACVLHYRAGDRAIKPDELVLIDAGCEFSSYAGDITRTFPAGGKFTKPQRAMYEIVLNALEAGIALVKPGARFSDIHDATVCVIAQGLLDLGILNAKNIQVADIKNAPARFIAKTLLNLGVLSAKPDATLDKVIDSRAYFEFYMHRAGHWMGMDVHDCGSYVEPSEIGQTSQRTDPLSGEQIIDRPSRILQAGMVFTIEPGIYIRPSDAVDKAYWNIGVRIEDDVLVTDAGCEILTRDVPVAVDAIEALMQEKTQPQ